MKIIVKDKAYWCEIWNRFRKGDNEAFRDIYNEFIDILFSYGMKFTSDREMIKDCIQDVFIEIKKINPNLNHPEYLEFYLYKCLRNAIFLKLENNKKIGSMLKEEVVCFDLKFYAEIEFPDDEYNRLRIEKLKKILLTIDSKKREILYLKFNTGLNYIEIGNLLDMNSEAVKKQIYRVLDYIRTRYGKQLLELFFFFKKGS